ncbi:MAG: hypothetical protein FJ148_15430 [Deltaproteobacteria bacterium]|nr:hypothetical protein [Deltaproteobacteria bacterium]
MIARAAFVRSSVVVFAVALGPLVTPGVAKDDCIDDGWGQTWIGRPFQVSQKNKCRPWQGFMVALAPPGGAREICSGTACRSAVGDEGRITMTCASTYSSAMKVVAFSIDPEHGTGTKYERYPDIGPGASVPHTDGGAVVVTCLVNYAVP